MAEKRKRKSRAKPIAEHKPRGGARPGAGRPHGTNVMVPVKDEQVQAWIAKGALEIWCENGAHHPLTYISAAAAKAAKAGDLEKAAAIVHPALRYICPPLAAVTKDGDAATTEISIRLYSPEAAADDPSPVRHDALPPTLQGDDLKPHRPVNAVRLEPPKPQASGLAEQGLVAVPDNWREPRDKENA